MRLRKMPSRMPLIRHPQTLCGPDVENGFQNGAARHDQVRPVIPYARQFTPLVQGAFATDARWHLWSAWLLRQVRPIRRPPADYIAEVRGGRWPVWSPFRWFPTGAHRLITVRHVPRSAPRTGAKSSITRRRISLYNVRLALLRRCRSNGADRIGERDDTPGHALPIEDAGNRSARFDQHQAPSNRRQYRR